jgi:hypothetical protein
VSLAGGLNGRLPRWLMWLGVAIGVSAELASLTLLSNAAVPLLPLARFSGLVWLICVGALLPVSRERAGSAPSRRPERLSSTVIEQQP